MYVIDDGAISSSTSAADFTFSSILDVAVACLECIHQILTFPSSSAAGVQSLILGGWSYGGVVAVEVARLLHRGAVSSSGLVGEGGNRTVRVSYLILIDSPVQQPILRATNHGHRFEEKAKSAGEKDLGRKLDPHHLNKLAVVHFAHCTRLLQSYYQGGGAKSLPYGANHLPQIDSLSTECDDGSNMEQGGKGKAVEGTEGPQARDEGEQLDCIVVDIRPAVGDFDCGFAAVQALVRSSKKGDEGEKVRREVVSGDHWTMIFGENSINIATIVKQCLK